jgi:hypothetical protein
MPSRADQAGLGVSRERFGRRIQPWPDASSLSDLKEIGCKNGGTVHFLPLSWAIEQLLPGEIVENCPRSAFFSLRFLKSDRLLARPAAPVQRFSGMR